MQDVHQWMKHNGMHMSWFVAMIATIGSLYFSEILLYVPCKLCWYQRIMMYPLAIILGIAAVRKDMRQSLYVLPLSIWGAGIAIYHILMQKTNLFKEEAVACGPIPCDLDYINWLGFISIPMLSATAFILITVLQLWMYWLQRQS